MADRHARTGYDWRVYRDATCAGLTPLIPVPIVDLLVEAHFRRRMPRVIALARGRRLERLAILRLGRRRGYDSVVAGCLALPIGAVRYAVKKLWRTIVYVLAIADAAALVSEYWHRAFLIDHMVRAGHLDPGTDLERATAVFSRALREADTSPLRGLAREVMRGGGRLLRLLIRARRRDPAEEADSLGRILRPNWEVAERSLWSVAARYNQLYVSWPQDPTDQSAPPQAAAG